MSNRFQKISQELVAKHKVDNPTRDQFQKQYIFNFQQVQEE
ncbi:unnamed protein product [Paramecium sonneborni]|uniref:Uncharacterized protein n=1 Tax=Paramecium sonneborni TaxID=65129 RepID=A0A8S1R2X3_9CILI|nr:unnamed protein product [Paramecium sonneborni]